MSGFLFGFLWNNGMENFDFNYTEKDTLIEKTLNTSKLNEQSISELKSKILSIEINNIQIDNINTHFCELNIESILFNRCKINSIKNLKINKYLKKIIIVDSDIKDISKLEYMEIEHLSITSSENIFLDDIVKLKNLRELYYKSNIKTDYELINMENLSNLIILNLYDNNINSIKNIGTLKNLISIDLGYNKLESIEVLQNYKTLKYVYLNSNKIINACSLENNCDIKYLNLSDNNISNIDFITRFQDIEILNTHNNLIKIIPNLLQFKKLDFTFLNIDWKQVEDLKGMNGYKLIKNIIQSLIAH